MPQRNRSPLPAQARAATTPQTRLPPFTFSHQRSHTHPPCGGKNKKKTKKQLQCSTKFGARPLCVLANTSSLTPALLEAAGAEAEGMKVRLY